jgi:hypothetical protein
MTAVTVPRCCQPDATKSEIIAAASSRRLVTLSFENHESAKFEKDGRRLEHQAVARFFGDREGESRVHGADPRIQRLLLGQMCSNDRQ